MRDQAAAFAGSLIVDMRAFEPHEKLFAGIGYALVARYASQGRGC
jgi:hypothetical protein